MLRISYTGMKDFELKLQSSSNVSESMQSNLKELFELYIRCDMETVIKSLNLLENRLINKEIRDRTSLDSLLLRLMKDYPNDIGVFAPLLLNYILLEPGDSFFMGANVPHGEYLYGIFYVKSVICLCVYIAYLSGDCVECMALSDNVVRVGLTPKYKDVETLCRMLVYASTSISDCYIQPVSIDTCTKLYRPPIQVCEEFEMELTNIPIQTEYTIRALPCASIILVWSGAGSVSYSTAPTPLNSNMDMDTRDFITQWTVGSVIYLPANIAIQCTDISSNIILYRAHVNCTLL